MSPTLPWKQGTTPLMLAPMQGLTNRALRALFIEWVKPDVVFTEFVRVRPAHSRQAISKVDQLEVSSSASDTPLVVQLIGNNAESLGKAAEAARNGGAVHLNINLGCPYGRMSAGSSGGALLKDPTGLAEKLIAIKEHCESSFSVKVRSGYDDPTQIFSLLPIFEKCGVDFLIIHPRTVEQKFAGSADHDVTTKVIRETNIPVIANGDVITAADGHRIIEQTEASGLMVGRGAIRDPLIFQRLRGLAPERPGKEEREAETQHYLCELVVRYREIFHDDNQILSKIKTVVNLISQDEQLARHTKKLLRSKNLASFMTRLDSLA